MTLADHPELRAIADQGYATAASLATGGGEEPLMAAVAAVLAEHTHPGELIVSLGEAWMRCGCDYVIDVAVVDERAQIGDANREWRRHVAAVLLATVASEMAS